MALKNKYQREKQQYSNDGGINWYDVSPANYRRGRLLEVASPDCNTIEWREVLGSWFCVPDTYSTRWITESGQYECVGCNKYSVEKEQSTVDGGMTWTDTGETRIGTLIETNSPDCGYNNQYRWINVSDDYECDGMTKYNKEKEQVSTDDGETWTDTGNTRRGNVVIERYSIDCGYVPLTRWINVSDDYYCLGNDKYAMQQKQVSMDNGTTWEDVTPPTYRQGSLIEQDSDDCKIYEKYLTTEMLSDGSIGIETTGSSALTNIAYSKNGGEWTSISYGQYVNVVNGDIIRWKANGYQTTNTGGTGQLYTTAYSYSYYSYFNSTADFNAYGNPKSLLYSDDFATFNESGISVRFLGLFRDAEHLINAKRLAMPSNLANSAFNNMFSDCTSLTTAPELPATTLTPSCYSGMFADCTSLTTTPTLPALTMAGGCYNGMFEGCTGLTTAPELPATTLAVGCYSGMFQGCTSLTAPPALPATTLAESCYVEMFIGCTSLTTAPELPATTLANSCYYYMFADCTSLTTTPALNATTLADFCYAAMFSGCSNLASAPVLPAISLAVGCYNYMFRLCTSLTTAPELPATTLATQCYSSMFYRCTSLTTAPKLNATTLLNYSYYEMFYGCTSLNNITCLATDISATNCTHNWLYGVAASGTFTKATSMSSWTSGKNGIPSNWTVVTA